MPVSRDDVIAASGTHVYIDSVTKEKNKTERISVKAASIFYVEDASSRDLR